VEEIEIPYRPREWFLPLHENQKRWIVIVAHRRSGKTTAVLNHLQRDCINTPNSLFGFIAPTYKQAKAIGWDMIKHYSNVIPGIEYNEVELTVKYPNGSKLRFFGADSPDSLRGLGFWGVVFDEYSQQPSNIFSEIIRPALADHNGYAVWIGTPKGKNEFYNMFEWAKKDQNSLAILLTIDDTKILFAEELADARKVMTIDEFNQEFYCSFEAAVQGAIYMRELGEAKLQKRIGIVPHDRILKVHTVWDLGKGANMAIGFFQRSFNQVRLIDVWNGAENEALPQAIVVIQRKNYVYGKHFAPHDIKATDLSTGKTRKETARLLGINFDEVPDIGIENGINAAKLFWSHLWIDAVRCTPFLDAISQYRREWDENRGMWKDKPYHDFSSHYADMLRYAAIVEDRMINDNEMNYSTYEKKLSDFDPYQ